MKIILNFLSDRGSKYAVSGRSVTSKLGASDFIKDLKRNKKFSKARHNTWAVILSNGIQIKNDDGEAGAGAIMLRMIETAELYDHIVVVTRWYGGTHLGGDRFRHIKTCMDTYISTL